MHKETGKSVPQEDVDKMLAAQREKHIPMRRNLTARKKLDAQIKLYAPCPCGSGKKFKFCCKKSSTR